MNRLVLVLALAAISFSFGCARMREPAKETPAPATPAAEAHAPGWHADHDPKHGGLLFMAANLYHHLEGTYPEAGLFRLYLYDDYTKPIDALGVTGFVRLTTAPASERIPLVHEAATQTLIARIDPPPAMPAEFQLTLNLTDPKTQVTSEVVFNFPFTRVGGEKAVAHAHSAGEHEHSSPHGGQVVSAGSDHHLELVDAGGLLTLWVLDAQENTLPVKGMQATLLLQPKNGTLSTLPMPAMGDIHFMANSPLRSGESASAVATVTIDGRTVTARFTLGPSM